jgi:Ser/Thr protein kinase RdoA (MazF antagonist)
MCLGGSERRTFAARRPDGGRIVLRRFASAAPDAERRDAVEWRLAVLAGLRQEGFRVERPLPARGGSWFAGDWSAWTWLEGRAATPEDAPAIVPAVAAFHVALASVPYAAHLTEQAGLADRAAWEEEPIPSGLPPALAAPVEYLAAMRRPLPALRNQVIHGDLNYNNILIASPESGIPPGFIDMGPYWRPAPFAAAIAAYWLGPYLGGTDVLRHFESVPYLHQLLVRVGIRQLLRFLRNDPKRVPDLTFLHEFVRPAEIISRMVA